MESSLHRELKRLYGGSDEEREVRIDGFRIDAVARGRLIEIQRASLSAIRAKLAALLDRHRVTLVKPLAARTRIVRQADPAERASRPRFSPLRRTVFHLFEELVHLGGLFPHPRLHLEVVLVEQEELRVPRARRRFNRPDYRVVDRRLLKVLSRSTFKTARDLAALLPAGLPSPFHTLDLARAAGIPRWLAQKMVYCLRQSGALRTAGKAGNAVLYVGAGGASKKHKAA